MNKEILRVQGVSLKKDKSIVLKNMHINLFEGESIGLLGKKTTGKSMFAHVLAGDLKPNEGIIYINEQKADENMQRKFIGYVASKSRLVERLSLAENLFALSSQKTFYCTRKYEKLAKEIMLEYGMDVNIFSNVTFMPPVVHHLVRILGAIVRGARIIILDDIDDGYTAKERSFLIKTIKKINQEGLSVIYISHKHNAICENLSRLFIMSEGQIVKTFWETKEDSTVVARYISGINSSSLGGFLGEATDSRIFVPGFGDYAIYRGEIIGIADKDGTAGEIIQKMLSEMKSSNQIAAFMDGTSLDHDWLPDMSITENIVLSIAGKIASPTGYIRKKVLNIVKNDCEKELGLCVNADELRPVDLDISLRIKLAFYRWKMRNAKVIFLYNFARGIAPDDRQVLYDEINNVLENGGVIIFAASNIGEIMRICPKMFIASDGQLSSSFNCAQITVDQIEDFYM